MYCHYYQAKLLRKKTWFVMGSFRSEENLAFARALKAEEDIFEFFVPQDNHEHFLDFMGYLQKNGYVLSFKKKENRIKKQLEVKS